MNGVAGALSEADTPVPMHIELEPGVEDLLWRLGEDSVTVELTLDFEGPVQKQGVAFPGASEPSLGFQRVRVGTIDVWWRQRVVLASMAPRVANTPRPRRLVIGRVGRALTAHATYTRTSRPGTERGTSNG
jgi:hypothetical protein